MGHLARVTFREFSAALAERLIRYDVTPGQWRFLRVLWERDGITQRELAERVGATEATTVRAIRGLLENALVERRDDPDDRRKFRIALTPRARRLEAQLVPYVAEVHVIAENGIPKADLETTRRVLRAIHGNLTARARNATFDEDRFA
jgi:DNA-binding MarR family transcriptional regulator